MVPINVNLPWVSQGNTKLKLSGLDDLSKFDNRIESNISVYDFSVLIELKISLCYFSTPEIESRKIKLVVFGFNKAHKIILFLAELVFKESVKFALVTYSVGGNLFWPELMISWFTLIHPDVYINDSDFVVIAHVEVRITYSKVFNYINFRIKKTVIVKFKKQNFCSFVLNWQDTYRICHSRNLWFWMWQLSLPCWQCESTLLQLLLDVTWIRNVQ